MKTAKSGSKSTSAGDKKCKKKAALKGSHGSVNGGACSSEGSHQNLFNSSCEDNGDSDSSCSSEMSSMESIRSCSTAGSDGVQSMIR